MTPTVNSHNFTEMTWSGTGRGPPAVGSQGTAVGKGPHWASGSQGAWGDEQN